LVVKVNKELVSLYESKRLNCEMSVEWVLGYINKKYSALISRQIITEMPQDYILSEVDDELVKAIYRKFDSSIDINAIFNFLCTMALLLGGEE